MSELNENSVKRILKLEQNTINRIAAGEIIQRPANALKEMIENSLDAKATTIQVTVKEGGLKLLQIQDNGQGIREEDLGIVCERFTTSKLREFKDLQTIATYGFRGEALSSISHIAHVSITTRTANSRCAFQVMYSDSKPKGLPKPCAGNQGTLISVEDLFYNVPIRRKAFQNAATEYAKICEVVGRYAIHNARVGFSLKKQSGTVSDIKTNPNSTVQDNIKLIYGAETARDLLDVHHENDSLSFKMSGYISGAGYGSSKTNFLLFINHRLVESAAIRRTVDAVYLAYLQKHKFPFVYLSLEIASQNVDVNVHPTKQEVHFLHENDILADIQKVVETRLLNSSQARTIYLQTLLPSTKEPSCKFDETLKAGPSSCRPQSTVRTDCRDQKLDAFIRKVDQTAQENGNGVRPKSTLTVQQVIGNRKTTFTNEPKQRTVTFTSVCKLREKIEKNCANDLREMFRDHCFVGCVNREHALIQHETKLVLLNTHELSRQLFYQIMLYDFGNFSVMKLSSAASIYELVLMALDDPDSGWEESNGSKEENAKFVAEFLPTKSEMMQDLFSMEIDKDGNLLSIPYLLEDYVPSFEGLPSYLLRLASNVNWDDEEECFDTICIETSRFYAFAKHSHTAEASDDILDDGVDLESLSSTEPDLLYDRERRPSQAKDLMINLHNLGSFWLSTHFFQLFVSVFNLRQKTRPMETFWKLQICPICIKFLNAVNRKVLCDVEQDCCCRYRSLETR